MSFPQLSSVETEGEGLSFAVPLVCLKQDFQDFQDEQDEEEKVWKTLMSIERRRNQEKRSVRPLMFIASEAGWPG